MSRLLRGLAAVAVLFLAFSCVMATDETDESSECPPYTAPFTEGFVECTADSCTISGCKSGAALTEFLIATASDSKATASYSNFTSVVECIDKSWTLKGNSVEVNAYSVCQEGCSNPHPKNSGLPDHSTPRFEKTHHVVNENGHVNDFHPIGTIMYVTCDPGFHFVRQNPSKGSNDPIGLHVSLFCTHPGGNQKEDSPYWAWGEDTDLQCAKETSLCDQSDCDRESTDCEVVTQDGDFSDVSSIQYICNCRPEFQRISPTKCERSVPIGSSTKKDPRVAASHSHGLKNVEDETLQLKK